MLILSLRFWRSVRRQYIAEWLAISSPIPFNSYRNEIIL